MKELEVLREMLTGKKVDGKKPTIGELEEILAHRDIQLLPDGSITSIKITKTEQAALSSAIKLMEEVEKVEGVLPKEKYCLKHNEGNCQICDTAIRVWNTCLHEVKLNLAKAGLVTKEIEIRRKNDY